MIEFDGWWMPDHEGSGFMDIKREWNLKHQSVLSRVPRLRNCVQAGAHIGIFPINLAEHFEHVYTFEPVFENSECLHRNALGVENLTIHEVALGEEEARALVQQRLKGNSGATRLQQSENGNMPVKTIDSYELEDVDLMWLDLEGFEVKALNGARETIEEYSPVLVLENNGLIHEFRGGLDGSTDFRKWMYDELGYLCVDRLMRDDVFIKET